MRMIVCLDGKQEEPYGTLILLYSAGHRMLCQGAGRNRRRERYPACLKVMVCCYPMVITTPQVEQMGLKVNAGTWSMRVG